MLILRRLPMVSFCEVRRDFHDLRGVYRATHRERKVVVEGKAAPVCSGPGQVRAVEFITANDEELTWMVTQKALLVAVETGETVEPRLPPTLPRSHTKLLLLHECTPHERDGVLIQKSLMGYGMSSSGSTALTETNLAEALQRIIEETGRDVYDMDADDGDRIIQYAVFQKLVFG